MEATREESSPPERSTPHGTIGHHTTNDGLFESHTQVVRVVFGLGRREAGEHLGRPGGGVPADEGVGVGSLGAKEVAWREGLEARALVGEGFHFGGYKDGTVVGPADVERRFADVVSYDEEEVFALVVQDERDHASQFLGQLYRCAVLAVQWKYHLAVRSGLRLVRRLQLGVQV